MNSSYIFGIVGAVVVLMVGVFLLGRDGTDDATRMTEIRTETLPSETSELLPIDENASTTESLGGEPELESEADDDASTSTVSDLPETDTGIVEYTSSGFSPKTITINEGDTVTFINNSPRNMWVASNIHPTHNEYPVESDEDCLGSSFDACKGVKTGESWSFTFDEVGEWGYHDHLSSSRTGTIIVE